MESNFMQPFEHAYNLILKGISNINNVIQFNQALNKRDVDFLNDLREWCHIRK